MTKILELQEEKSEQDEKKHKMFYLEMLFMWLLIVARNVLHINIPVLAILAVGALIAALGDRDEIIALAVCCIPMSSSFQYKYLILLCIIIYALKFSKDVRLTHAAFPLVLMMVWELLHGIGYDFSIYEYLRDFSELIFVTFLIMLKPRKIDFPFITRVLAWISVGMMLIVLANLLIESNFDLSAIFNGYYRFGVSKGEGAGNFGGTYNPNGLGMICNLAISCIMILFVSKKIRFLDYIAAALLPIFGIMTMSRAFLICLALLAVLFILSTHENPIKKLRTILLLVLIAVLILSFINTTMPYVIEQFTNRFEEDDVTNGRDVLFAFYNQHIFSSAEYLLFGIGIQDSAGKINAIYNADYLVSHNGTQELVICWGLVGLVLFCWFIYRLVKGSGAHRKRLANFLPLLFLLLYVQSGQLITNGVALLALAVSFIALKNNIDEVQAHA